METPRFRGSEYSRTSWQRSSSSHIAKHIHLEEQHLHNVQALLMLSLQMLFMRNFLLCVTVQILNLGAKQLSFMTQRASPEIHN